MSTLDIVIQKLHQLSPEQQHKVIEFIEFLEFQSTQTSQQPQPKAIETAQQSFAEATQEFRGCLESELDDLSYNSKYLDGFGES